MAQIDNRLRRRMKFGSASVFRKAGGTPIRGTAVNRKEICRRFQRQQRRATRRNLQESRSRDSFQLCIGDPGCAGGLAEASCGLRMFRMRLLTSSPANYGLAIVASQSASRRRAGSKTLRVRRAAPNFRQVMDYPPSVPIKSGLRRTGGGPPPLSPCSMHERRFTFADGGVERILQFGALEF